MNGEFLSGHGRPRPLSANVGRKLISSMDANIPVSRLPKEDRGELLAVFGPSLVHVVMGSAVAAIFTGFGTLVIADTIFELAASPSLGTKSDFYAGLFFLILGGLYFWPVSRLRRRRVSLYRFGFVVKQRRRVQEFPWSRIIQVREQGRRGTRPPAPGQLTGEGTDYGVVRDDGQVFSLNRELADWGQLRDVVLREASARGIRMTFVEHVEAD